MIIFKPHREALEDSMREAKEFNTEKEMKEYIVRLHHGYISLDDIVIDSEHSADDRIGWNDGRYVCTKRYGEENYIEKYGCPQCIGNCATDYIKTVNNNTPITGNIDTLKSLGIDTETYIINVQNHTYIGDRAYVDNLIKIGKEAMKGKRAIIAVEKDKTVILLSQPHKTPKQLGISMAEYVSKGFKVYTA